MVLGCTLQTCHLMSWVKIKLMLSKLNFAANSHFQLQFLQWTILLRFPQNLVTHQPYQHHPRPPSALYTVSDDPATWSCCSSLPLLVSAAFIYFNKTCCFVQHHHVFFNDPSYVTSVKQNIACLELLNPRDACYSWLFLSGGLSYALEFCWPVTNPGIPVSFVQVKLRLYMSHSGTQESSESQDSR